MTEPIKPAPLGTPMMDVPARSLSGSALLICWVELRRCLQAGGKLETVRFEDNVTYSGEQVLARLQELELEINLRMPPR